MPGIHSFPEAPMGAIYLFSSGLLLLHPETPGILAASHWQLPKLAPSPDVLVSLQPVYGAKYSLFIGSQVFAGPDRCTQAPFILTYGFIANRP